MGFLNSIGKFFANILAFFIKAFIVTIMIFGFFAAFEESGSTKSGANLAEISLKGAIVDETLFLQEVEKLKKNNNIKGVLLNINSPGGGLSPSFEIALAIKELNAKKPVIAYASGTMASGSYLGGVWSSKIYANKGSMIGSIGVILQGLNVKELTDKLGISTQTVKAGEYKEAGTMMREWSELEKASLQKLTNDSYNLFISEVASARKLDKNRAEIWANARVFLADEAVKLGLVDGISSYSKVKDEVAKIAGVSEPVWLEKSRYDAFVDSFSSKMTNAVIGEFSLKLR